MPELTPLLGVPAVWLPVKKSGPCWLYIYHFLAFILPTVGSITPPPGLLPFQDLLLRGKAKLSLECEGGKKERREEEQTRVGTAGLSAGRLKQRLSARGEPGG